MGVLQQSVRMWQRCRKSMSALNAPGTFSEFRKEPINLCVQLHWCYSNSIQCTCVPNVNVRECGCVRVLKVPSAKDNGLYVLSYIYTHTHTLPFSWLIFYLHPFLRLLHFLHICYRKSCDVSLSDWRAMQWRLCPGQCLNLHLRYSCRMHHSQRQGLKVCVWEREIPFISLPDLMQEMNPSRILKSINLARLLSPPSWQQALNHINVFFCQLKKKTSSFQVVTDHLLHPQQCA